MPEAVERNVGTWDSDANGEATSGRTMRARVRKRSPGAEQLVVCAEQRVLLGRVQVPLALE